MFSSFLLWHTHIVSIHTCHSSAAVSIRLSVNEEITVKQHHHRWHTYMLCSDWLLNNTDFSPMATSSISISISLPTSVSMLHLLMNLCDFGVMWPRPTPSFFFFLSFIPLPVLWKCCCVSIITTDVQFKAGQTCATDSVCSYSEHEWHEKAGWKSICSRVWEDVMVNYFTERDNDACWWHSSCVLQTQIRTEIVV